MDSAGDVRRQVPWRVEARTLGFVDDKLDRAYAVAGLAIGLVIIIISVDLLLGGRVSAVFGKPPRLSVVPRETSEEAS